MKPVFAVLSLILFSTALYASTSVAPDTTLSREAGNNTSTASSFATHSDGNVGAANVSKVPIRKLLYTGFSGKVYAHLMPWFGGSNHMNVGYESDSASQVANQVADMMSRGLDGAIVDWYGPNFARENGTTRLLRTEAEKHPGKFEFAVMEDVGALGSCARQSGCNVTTQMISDLTYAYDTYESSPAYMRQNGRPVVFFFGVEAYSIDWARVSSSVPGNPLFIQRNAIGFSNSNFDGSFAWLAPNLSNPADIGTGYLNYFYGMSTAHPSALTFGTAYKGFNDTLAAWTAHRIINQNCGQTFLNSFAEINKYYSTSRQLHAVQMVTWNDYEEGTELESGIDNCVSVSASVTGTKLNWTMTGAANTLDHYAVYISTDGTNLMTVGNVAVGTNSYDFSGYGLAAGTYQVFVKAVGAPFMLNHMSPAVAMYVGQTTAAPVAKLTLSASNVVAGQAVTASTSGSSCTSGTIASSTVDFGDGTVMSGANPAHAYAKAGNYTVTATVVDSKGSSAKSTAALAVTAPGVTVISPTPNATLANVVHFQATARAATPVIAMAIYVDNILQTKVYTASVDTSLTLAAGTRAVTVQAWDSKGVVYKTSMSVTVNRVQAQSVPRVGVAAE